ncbi:MAG: hypothetical protein Q8K74_03990 [Candidatus Nitrotoga sp.]|nr:hypothetical protein [Candidatus Nitrotoga sp.]MDP1855200.1 hypothetical protein [Candidatus Nitrotoga sp.]MDP3497613.1 hypothetical protein [Candidatus Nitrotoga sp.]
MKRELYLHIGLPKTGTTYLQCQIQYNREKLISNSIYVPKIGQATGRDHNLLALALQPERWHQFSDEISASLPSMWHDLLEEIDNCGCQTILVTSEAFSWELKTAEQIKSVRDYFANYDVRIVFCERNPYDFISSMYGQLIKTGRGPYPLDSFLLEFPYYWSTAYQRKRWGDFFGDNNFIVLSYEDLKGEFIFLEFLKKLFPGHAILSECFDFAPNANLNLSYSPRFLRFLEELSANQIDSAPYVNLYSEELKTIVPLERQMLKPVDIDEAMKRCGMELEGWLDCSALDNCLHTEYGSVTGELIHSRQILVERTVLLEQANKDLLERTEELVNTRQTLVERTALLEQANNDLLERTEELVNIRQTLVERTALLEQANNDLLKRTEDL